MKEILASVHRVESRLLLAENKLALFPSQISTAKAAAMACESRSLQALDLAVKAWEGLEAMGAEIPKLQEGLIEAFSDIAELQSDSRSGKFGEELVKELGDEFSMVSPFELTTSASLGLMSLP